MSAFQRRNSDLFEKESQGEAMYRIDIVYYWKEKKIVHSSLYHCVFDVITTTF